MSEELKPAADILDNPWGAVGHGGTVLTVKRREDGTAVVAMFHQEDGTDVPIRGMVLSAEAVMDLNGYLLGASAAGARN